MNFKIENLEYAYTHNLELENIVSAEKLKYYFLDIKKTIPLILCEGDKIKKYWRKKSNISELLIKKHFGNSESIEHYNQKMQFVYDKQFEVYFIKWGTNLPAEKYLIKASFGKPEYYIKDINKIIDVVLFDEYNQPIAGIEVYHTNKKTELDIKKFNQLNFPIYEYDINTKTIYPISTEDVEIEEISEQQRKIETIRKRISESKNRIIRGGEFIQRQQTRINFLRKRIDQQNRRFAKWYFPIKEEIEYLRQQNKDVIFEQTKKILSDIRFYLQTNNNR